MERRLGADPPARRAAAVAQQLWQLGRRGSTRVSSSDSTAGVCTGMEVLVAMTKSAPARTERAKRGHSGERQRDVCLK
jgi:hypothetical protein